MVEQLVTATLSAMGVHTILLGLATTPTVEVAVTELNADGGIILTASHNPAQWNALKLLNGAGEFLSADDGAAILEKARSNDYSYADVKKLGTIKPLEGMDIKHIEQVLELDLVDVEKIEAKKFKVAIDCVNSVGGVVLPRLLKSLGVDDVVELYCDPTGDFPHNPEPLPEGADADQLLEAFQEAYAKYDINTVDGVKVDMPEGWVHLRKSNTEPIIRLYAEAARPEEAERIAGDAMNTINGLI